MDDPNSLTMLELADRSVDMETCISRYDKSFDKLDSALYRDADRMYLGEMHNRELRFMSKRGVLREFLQQDAQSHSKAR